MSYFECEKFLTILIKVQDKKKPSPTKKNKKSSKVFESASERDFRNPFDVKNYPEEWSMFKDLFKEPISRLVRYFAYIYNMYHVYSLKTQKQKIKELDEAPNKRKYLSNETNSFLTYEFVYYFYLYYAPEKAQEKDINTLLDKYANMFTLKYGIGDYTNYLINQLYKKYIFNVNYPEKEFIFKPLFFGVNFNPGNKIADS